MKYFTKIASKTTNAKTLAKLIRDSKKQERIKKTTKEIAEMILKLSPRHIRYKPVFKV